MGTVVLHAGMHKTGSSSIQRWLRDSSPRLRERAIAPLAAEVGPDGEVQLAVNDGSATMNSWRVMAHLDARPEHGERLAASLFAELDRHADSARVVILSAESFGLWFSKPEPTFLDGLEALARRRDLRVACYLRPQHSALEASWRASGLRSPRSPSEFLDLRARRRDYLRMVRVVEEAAPGIGFAPRPFRRDLLAEGDVVADFGRAFLGLEMGPGEAGEVWRNPSLPLALVNALRGAPGVAGAREVGEGEAAERGTGGRAGAMPALKQLAARVELPESERLRLSRLVLRQACHDRFEAGNRELIARLDWPTDEWVPPVEEEIGEASFERLDELWRPAAGAVELALLHAAVGRVLELSRRPSPAG